MESGLSLLDDDRRDHGERDKSRSPPEQRVGGGLLSLNGPLPATETGREPSRGYEPKAAFGVSSASSARRTDPSDSMASWNNLSDPLISGDGSIGGAGTAGHLAQDGALAGSVNQPPPGFDDVMGMEQVGAQANRVVQSVTRPDGEVWFRQMETMMISQEMLTNVMLAGQFRAESAGQIYQFMEQVRMKFDEVSMILTRMRDTLSSRDQEFVGSSNRMAQELFVYVSTTKREMAEAMNQLHERTKDLENVGAYIEQVDREIREALMSGLLNARKVADDHHAVFVRNQKDQMGYNQEVTEKITALESKIQEVNVAEEQLRNLTVGLMTMDEERERSRHRT